MNKEIKKKKLTISIPANIKSKNIDYKKNFNKTAFVVEKKSFRNKFKDKLISHDKPNKFSKLNQIEQTKPHKSGRFTKKSELRKIAEQRATKGIKKKESLDESKTKFSDKSKLHSQKREYKLTLSRALNEEDTPGRERSLASIRRARLKEKKNIYQNKNIEELQKVIRDVNIPKIITIQELSNRMAEQANNLIKHLLGMGVVATINHSIDSDTAEYLVKEFGHNPIRQTDVDKKYSKDKGVDKKNLETFGKF